MVLAGGAWRASSPGRSLRWVVRTSSGDPSSLSSRVGALAVVGGLLLAAAALTSGLAHGVLLWSVAPEGEGHPLSRPGAPRNRGGRRTPEETRFPQAPTRRRRPMLVRRCQRRVRKRSASTTTRVTSPVPTTRPPPTSRASTLKRWRRPSPMHRGRGHLERRPDAAGARVLELDPGADRRLARCERRLDGGTGGGLAPGEEVRRAEDRQRPGPDRCGRLGGADGEGEGGGDRVAHAGPSSST